MAPNHAGDPLGSILGPMGSHWGKKMCQNRNKLPCPKIRICDYSAVIDLGKYRIHGYGAKSRWGHPRAHLEVNGVPLGQKNGSKPSKITMPQNSNFLLLRGHRFGQKIEFKVMAPNHGGDPVGSISGPMGSHWDQKMGQNGKKLPYPTIRIFDYSGRSSIWAKIELMVMAPNHGGNPQGSSLGRMGSHWGQKMGQNRKKLPCPIIRILTTPRSSIWAKNRINSYGDKSRWGTTPRSSIWSILGPMGSHWDQKMGQNRKKLPCPTIRIFYYSARSSIWAKIELMVMAPNHGGEPLGSILGPMGSHWGKKMGQKGKKLLCPKIWIFYYSAVIDLGKKSNLRLWRQITVETP